MRFAQDTLRGTVVNDCGYAAPEVRRKLLESGPPGLRVPVALNCLVLDIAGERLLIDTGLGRQGTDDSPTGHLPDGLRAAGLPPESITLVLLTHTHPDHVGGLFDGDGNLAFPNARIALAAREWATIAPPEGMPFLPGRHHRLAALRDRVQIVPDEGEVLPGVRTMPAPGHTPGQVVVVIHKAESRLLHAADVIAHPMHVAHPAWNTNNDEDRVQASATRQRFVAWAGGERILVFGYHFPFPGLGYISPANESWRWEPLAL